MIDGPVPARSGEMQNLRDHIKLSAIIVALALSISTVTTFRAAAQQAVLERVPNPEIASLLERQFTLPMLLDNVALSLEEREGAVAAEVTKLTELLTAQGYLGALVQTTGSGSTEDPFRLRPVPGPLYRIGDIRIDGLSPKPDPAFDAAIEALVAQQKSMPTRRSVVEALGPAILYELRQRSFASAALQDVAFDLDPQTAIADLIIKVDPGPPTRFQRVDFRGSLRMGDSEAQALIPFKPGAAYSLAAIEGLRNALDQTGMFSRIRIEADVDPDAPGEINLSVRLWDKETPFQATAQPYILFATILMLAVIQVTRMTSYWSNRNLRLLLLFSAFMLLIGSAIEVMSLLYLFLFN